MRASQLNGLVRFVKTYGTGRIVCVIVDNTTVVRPRVIVVIAYRRDNVKTQTHINGDAEAGGRLRITLQYLVFLMLLYILRGIHTQILIHNTQNWLELVSLEFLVRKHRAKGLNYSLLKFHKVCTRVCTYKIYCSTLKCPIMKAVR